MQKYNPNLFLNDYCFTLKEEKEYEQFCQYTKLYESYGSHAFILNEFSFPKELMEKLSFIKELAKATQFKIKDLFNLIKDKKIFKIFSYIKWNITNLAELIQKGFQVYKDLQLAIADFVKKTKVMKFTTDKIKDLSDFLEKHPKIKKYSGIAVAGLLVLIWLNMSFTGDFFDDFDLGLVFQCLTGTYSLAEIFTSKEGIRMLSLFALGMITKISFPYPGSNLIKFTIAVITTLAKSVKAKLTKGDDSEEFS